MSSEYLDFDESTSSPSSLSTGQHQDEDQLLFEFDANSRRGIKCKRGAAKCCKQLMDSKPVNESEQQHSEQSDKARADEQVATCPVQRSAESDGAASVAGGELNQQQRHPTSVCRCSTPPNQMVLSPLRRHLQADPSYGRRSRRQAARHRHSLELTRRRARQLREQQTLGTGGGCSTGLNAGNITRQTLPTSTPSTATTSSCANPAVRVLFKDSLRQHQDVEPTRRQRRRRQRRDSLNKSNAEDAAICASGSSSSVCGDNDSNGFPRVDEATHQINDGCHNQQQQQPPAAAAVVEASRRLIERQIESIREADSRRWNFDFANFRPLNQAGHRYFGHHQQQRASCLRPARTNQVNDGNNNNRNDTVEDLEELSQTTSENDNTSDNISDRCPSMATSTQQMRDFKPLNDQDQNRDL